VGTLVKNPHLNLYQGRRVLLTGHTGFKGSWLCLLLKMLGAEVMGYALAPEYEGGHFDRLGLSSSISHVIGDIRDPGRLQNAFREFQPEFVFHLAAQALVRHSYRDSKTTFDTNVGGAVNLLEAVRGCDSVRALVFVTSDKCYENVEWIWGYRENDVLGGHDPYSASKAAAEIVFSSYTRSFFAQRPNLGVATVRAGNVIGGGDWAADRIIPDCVRALVANEPIRIRSPNATRPWQHVLEPLAGYMQLGARLFDEGHQYDGAWNFGPHVGDVRSVLEVAEAVVAEFGRGSLEVHAPADKPHEAHLLQLNSDKARQLLGWTTRWDFDQTVQATAGWYRDVILKNGDAREISSRQITDYFGEPL
jgi:CDP-glucose 4,6-dehydratase